MTIRHIAERIGSLLRNGNLRLVLAESCTGGLVSDIITDVPGSSDYFRGGFVVYSNEAKMRLLGVQEATLERFGAVSAQCAAEMARGARLALDADIALSITGIAGPTGATADKPVGLTYFHLSTPDTELGIHRVWDGDRRANKERSAAAGLSLVLEYLERRKAS